MQFCIKWYLKAILAWTTIGYSSICTGIRVQICVDIKKEEVLGIAINNYIKLQYYWTRLISDKLFCTNEPGKNVWHTSNAKIYSIYNCKLLNKFINLEYIRTFLAN